VLFVDNSSCGREAQTAFFYDAMGEEGEGEEERGWVALEEEEWMRPCAPLPPEPGEGMM
jgi:hypothetical protein